MWEPELRDRVKAVLSPGTKIELAAEDFETPEQFVTFAHAARNTSVPFVLLKHRVLSEGRTLAEAIQELKPELNAEGRSRARTRSGAIRSGGITPAKLITPAKMTAGRGIIPCPAVVVHRTR